MAKHKLKVSNYKNGELEVLEFVYESLEEAIVESKKHHGHRKIYNEENVLVYTVVIESDNFIY